jgi:hypothetical protein
MYAYVEKQHIYMYVVPTYCILCVARSFRETLDASYTVHMYTQTEKNKINIGRNVFSLSVIFLSSTIPPEK